MQSIEIIKLDEIVPGATIRFKVIDGVQYLSIRDLIMHMCDKDGNHANDLWRTLPVSNKNELTQFLGEFQFPGPGQKKQPVITFPGAVQLSMFLPGENAKKNRTAMSKILVRYFAGDPSLIREIEANAKSDEPVAQMARDSLASEKENAFKISRKRELDQLEYEERRAALEQKRAETETMKSTSLLKVINQYNAIDALENMDPRAKIMFKSKLLNFATASNAITNGDDTAPICLSQIASAKGKSLTKEQVMAMGKIASELYRKKYGEAPSKHGQIIDGQPVNVNSYFKKDTELLEKALELLEQKEKNKHTTSTGTSSMHTWLGRT